MKVYVGRSYINLIVMKVLNCEAWKRKNNNYKILLLCAGVFVGKSDIIEFNIIDKNRKDKIDFEKLISCFRQRFDFKLYLA